MDVMKRVGDYVGAPQRMLLDLVELAEGNPRLRRMWQANYLRLTDEKREVTAIDA